MKFVFAHTNNETNLPSYCNMQMDEKGNLQVYVRSPGSSTLSLSEIPRHKVAELIDELTLARRHQQGED